MAYYAVLIGTQGHFDGFNNAMTALLILVAGVRDAMQCYLDRRHRF